MKKHMTLKKVKLAVAVSLGLLLFLNMCVLYSSIYRNTKNLEVDEDSHIHNSYYYKLLFVDRDLGSHEWDSYVFYDQPPIAKYVTGFALHTYGNMLVDTAAGARDWQQRALADFWIPRLEYAQFDTRRDAETVVQAEKLNAKAHELLEDTRYYDSPTRIYEIDVVIARLAIFAFEILATGVLMLILFYLTRSLILSLVGALLFVSNPITIPTFQTVYIDSIWCFFVLLSLLMLFILPKYLEQEKTKKVALLSVVMGVALGLAIGTKIIAVYVSVVIVGVLVLASVLDISKSKNKIAHKDHYEIAKLSALTLSIVASISAIIFIVSNPFLYTNTVDNVLKMFEHRHVIMEIQSITQGPLIETFSDRFGALIRFGILSGYDTRNVLELNLAAAYFIVLMLGLVRIWKKAAGELRKRNVGSGLIIFILSVVSYVFVGATVHMEWERYFLPLLLCNLLWFVFGLPALAEYFLEKRSK